MCPAALLLPAEDLVGALPAQHHLDPHGFDFTRHEEHRGSGADGGDVVCLEVVYDVGDSVDALFQREDELVVDRLQERRSLTIAVQDWVSGVPSRIG